MLRKILRFNWITFLSMAALAVIGVVFIRSAGAARTVASLQDAWRVHAATALFGLILYFVLAFIDYRKILDLFSTPCFLVSLILLVSVLAFGEKVYGGKRWLWFFQPSEIAKPAVILMIANIFGKAAPANGIRHLLLGLGLIAVPSLLILAEPDLGTALALVPATLVMLVCARVCLKVLLPLLATGLVGAGVILGAVHIAETTTDLDRRDKIYRHLPLKEHQVQRLKTFLDPEADPYGGGWNLKQAKISIGSGSLSGKGLGKGEQKFLGYLPPSVSMNDFIFSVLAEEAGFVGSFTVIALFMAMLLSGLWTALRSADDRGRLVVIGVMTLIFVHVYINIAMSIGLMPITGLPLPFISAGKTFLVVLWPLLASSNPYPFTGRKKQPEEIMLEKIINWFRKPKFKREIIVNVEKLETRVAVMENGHLEEYMVEHPEEERLVGSVFKGRIQNLEHDLQAAFVDIGLSKNAFLHYWDMSPDVDAFLDDDEEAQKGAKKDGKAGKRGKSRSSKLSNEEIEKRFPKGSEIIVQVTKGPISTKGPRVTANLSIPGRYLVMMPGEKLRGVSRKIGDANERIRLKKILDRLLMPEDVGVIVRTAGAGASPKAFARDLRNLLESWNELKGNVRNLRTPCCVYQEPDLVERVVRDWLTEDIDAVVIDDEKSYEQMKALTAKISRRAQKKLRRYDGAKNVFDHYGIERQLEEAFRRQVPLKSGGYLVIDETEALIAVDVNTGHHKSKEGKGSQEDAILEVNLEAVEEVARQLRLRNIGGLVVLDLIDMKSRKHQKQVEKALKTALKRDRARTNVLAISELGLLEMSRQRQEESILSMLTSTCPVCNGHGHVKSPLAISIELQRSLTSLLKRADVEKRPFVPKILVAPAVLQRLRTEDSKILAELQSSFNTKLTFVSELHRHPESFAILDAESGKTLYSSKGSRNA